MISSAVDDCLLRNNGEKLRLLPVVDDVVVVRSNSLLVGDDCRR